MNHGKSSLFNALLDKTVFKVEDIHTTVKQQEAIFTDNVIFIDTPGLSAEEKDTEEAFKAYARASFIVFVHTPNVGEIHRDELQFIEKMMLVSPSENYFWTHFCLVFTFTDATSKKDELDIIKNKSLADIKREFGDKKFPVFLVSNLRYEKGKQQNSELFLEKSGILELRKFIIENMPMWKKEKIELSTMRVEKLRKEVLNRVNQQKSLIEQQNTQKILKEKEVRNRIRGLVDNIYNSITDANSELEESKKSLDDLQNSIQYLQQQHRRERY